MSRLAALARVLSSRSAVRGKAEGPTAEAVGTAWAPLGAGNGREGGRRRPGAPGTAAAAAP